MKHLKHITGLTKNPESAQISNFQIFLEWVTAVIDRLLLAERQSAWKIVPGPGIDELPDTGEDIIPTIPGL